MKWFLGIQIIRHRSQLKLWLCQDSYLLKIATSFQIHNQTCFLLTPMVTDNLGPYDQMATPQDIYRYQQKVGSLLYATVITRPDAACTANKLAKSLLNPGRQHQNAADRAIAYLYDTRFYAIEFSADVDPIQTLVCASDAAFANNLQTLRSTERYLF